MGDQNLYNVSATWTSSASAAPTPSSPVANNSKVQTVVAATSRRLGFRVFALVTVNDTNATVVANKASASATGQVNDTGTHGMFFRVNGAPLYSRGANMIPMEEMEGQFHSQLLPPHPSGFKINVLLIFGGQLKCIDGGRSTSPLHARGSSILPCISFYADICAVFDNSVHRIGILLSVRPAGCRGAPNPCQELC